MKFAQKIAGNCLFITFCLFLTPLAGQETKTGFINQTYEDEAGEHKYVLFVPQNYSPDKKWPVILFLHGAGECGTDGVRQTTVGLGPYIAKMAESFQFITVFPQCEDSKGRILTRWRPEQPDGARAIKILEAVEKSYQTDPEHRILIGWSMGGYGAWAQGAANPKFWSAVVPMAGGGDPDEAAKLKETPVWAFHGAKDVAVKVDESRKMINALKAAGGKPLYTEVEDLDHESYKAAFDQPEFYRWLLQPMITSEPPLLVKPGTKFASPPTNLPFVPAVYIPRAAFIRLGNDALHDLSDAVPRLVPQEMLMGRIADLQDSISAEGRSFSVVFSGISYSGQLYRAQVKSYDSNRVNVQLGLTNLQLTINSTSVNSGRLGAWTGPISIIIGHNGPVWLSFDVQPVVDQGRIRLRLYPQQTRFEIPWGNWYVTNPAGVSTRGWGMTAERVSSGLVNGLYGSKARIESQVIGVVPRIVAELEKRITLSDIDQIMTATWPIPVFQPRIKMWPQEISTDEKGITLIMGATAAALIPKPKQDPKWANSPSRGLADVPKTTQLTVGMVPGAMKPVAELLIEDQIARINVLDTPVETLKQLADPTIIGEFIPDIKRFGDDAELWTELILTKAIDISEVDGKMKFDVPGLVISIAVKPKGEIDWQPYAEITFDVGQPAALKLLTPTATTRAIEFQWDEKPILTAVARFAPRYKPEDATIEASRIEELFMKGWTEWTQGGLSTKVNVPDVDFGYTRLRLKQVNWTHPHLSVTFDKPGISLSNRTMEPLVYQTRGPYSPWSQSFTLRSGETDQFKIAYPLSLRRLTPQGVFEEIQLPAGSLSELRVPRGGGPARFYDSPDLGTTKTPPPPPPGAEVGN